MGTLKAIIGYYELTDYHWTVFFLLNYYTLKINHTYFVTFLV